DGVDVHRLRALRRGGRRRRGYPWLPFLAMFLITRRRTYDVVHVHEALHAAAVSVGIGHLLGKKCVVKVGGSGRTGNLAVLRSGRWSAPLTLRLPRRADALISLSREMSDELRYSGFDPAAIVEIPNGVDVAHFRSAAPLPGMERSVIVAARLSAEKALDVL